MDIMVKSSGVKETGSLNEYVVDILSTGDTEEEIENLKWAFGRLIEVLTVRNTLDIPDLMDILDIEPEYMELNP